jgi:hypothetical protein
MAKKQKIRALSLAGTSLLITLFVNAQFTLTSYVHVQKYAMAWAIL